MITFADEPAEVGMKEHSSALTATSYPMDILAQTAKGKPDLRHSATCHTIKAGGSRSSKRHTLKERMMYILEGILIRHGYKSQVILLFATMTCMVVVTGICYSFVWTSDPDDTREGSRNVIIEGMWEAWTFMADPGTQGKLFIASQRIPAATITIIGFLCFGTMLGLIVDMVRDMMETMKRRRTTVVEEGHILVLGWTDKTLQLVQELCSCCKNGTIIVMADEQADTMEVEMTLSLPKSSRSGTHIVCRNGSPLRVSDLLRVSADRAKCVIVLADAVDADGADSRTLRSILSLKSLEYKLRGHVVAEVRDIDNEPLLQLVGGRHIETLVSHDVLGRLMVMAARQRGLANVYEALLGFDGEEFYVKSWPELDGCEFGDLAARFPDAIPVGIQESHGQMFLNPPGNRELMEGESLVVIARDATSYKPRLTVTPVESTLAVQASHKKISSEKVLICGWRRDIRDVIKMLDAAVAPGSEIHLISPMPLDRRTVAEKLLDEGLDVTKLHNARLIHHAGNPSSRRRLEELPLEHFTSVMIFADQAFEQDTMHADSNTLATLLLVRDIRALRKGRGKSAFLNPHQVSHFSLEMEHVTSVSSLDSDNFYLDNNPLAQKDCPIICEILDPRTRAEISNNALVREASDFIQSTKLVAQVLAMIAHQRTVKNIFTELLSVHGCSIIIVTFEKLCSPVEDVSFLILSKRARSSGKTLIGLVDKSGKEPVVELNPTFKHISRDWTSCDFILLAGDSVTDKRKSLATPLEAAIASAAQMRKSRSDQGQPSRGLVENQMRSTGSTGSVLNRFRPGSKKPGVPRTPERTKAQDDSSWSRGLAGFVRNPFQAEVKALQENRQNDPTPSTAAGSPLMTSLTSLPSLDFITSQESVPAEKGDRAPSKKATQKSLKTRNKSNVAVPPGKKIRLKKQSPSTRKSKTFDGHVGDLSPIEDAPSEGSALVVVQPVSGSSPVEESKRRIQSKSPTERNSEKSTSPRPSAMGKLERILSDEMSHHNGDDNI
jgi:hypothetical protein